MYSALLALPPYLHQSQSALRAPLDHLPWQNDIADRAPGRVPPPHRRIRAPEELVHRMGTVAVRRSSRIQREVAGHPQCESSELPSAADRDALQWRHEHHLAVLSGSAETDQAPAEALASSEEDMEWFHPKIRELKKEQRFEKIAETLKAEEEKATIRLPKDKASLPINIEEFMVKQRPKTTTTVPKDAKAKLKTSAYGHVTNVPQATAKKASAPPKLEKPIPKAVTQTKLEEEKKPVPKPVAPTKLMEPEITKVLEKPKIPPAPTISEMPEELEAPEVHEPVVKTQEPKKAPVSDQRKTLEDSLMDFKIKKAKLQKMALDFDMQELSGEITSEELKEKKAKLSELEINIEEQIKQTEKMLEDL